MNARTLSGLDIERIRQDFPILGRTVRGGKPLTWLDTAATAQKPRQVITAVSHYYEHYNANVHRGVHALAEESTFEYEKARGKVKRFLQAEDSREIVFVRGTTEGINLVAQSFVRPQLQAGDEILITHMEHHSNIVPWQLLCEQTGAELRVAPITDDGELDVDAFASLVGGRTKFVSIVHVSNALGTVNPVAELCALAHEQGVPVLVDGAQAVQHVGVDVQALGCDFYVFSGHKAYAPTGIGALWGRAELLNDMPPYQGGGEMIESVSFDKTTYAKVPHRFEAGTPHISGAIGLGAAIDYLLALGVDTIAAHEAQLLEYGTEVLTEVPGLRVIGTARKKASVLGFVLESAHAHDVGTILDQQGVAVRAGHHCAQPVMQRFGVPATTRASLGLYNTREDLDRLVRGLHEVNRIFG